MGQYYFHVIEQSGVKQVFDTSIKDGEFNGMKLMEHSWWRNDIMNAVGSMMFNEPLRLAWVGDYSEQSELVKLNGHKRPFTYASVWGQKAKVHSHNLTDFKLPTDKDEEENLYLINHDKKIYVDMKRYYKHNVRDGWCINPISLLTAVGNGRGGGDYHDCYPGFDQIGSWAWDLIELNPKIPDGYKAVGYYFVEEEEEDIPF